MDDYLPFATERGLLEREPLLHAEVTAPTTARLAEAPREHLGEEILHVGEDISDASAHAAPFEARVSELVVDSTLVPIRQHLVGLVDLLEDGLRLRVTLVAVWVVLQRLALIGLANVLGRGVTGGTEYLVVAALLRHERVVEEVALIQ
jgi:hypothetical protein